MEGRDRGRDSEGKGEMDRTRERTRYGEMLIEERNEGGREGGREGGWVGGWEKETEGGRGDWGCCEGGSKEGRETAMWRRVGGIVGIAGLRSSEKKIDR